jgi:hypothetical protein
MLLLTILTTTPVGTRGWEIDPAHSHVEIAMEADGRLAGSVRVGRAA